MIKTTCREKCVGMRVYLKKKKEEEGKDTARSCVCSRTAITVAAQVYILTTYSNASAYANVMYTRGENCDMSLFLYIHRLLMYVYALQEFVVTDPAAASKLPKQLVFTSLHRFGNAHTPAFALHPRSCGHPVSCS